MNISKISTTSAAFAIAGALLLTGCTVPKVGTDPVEPQPATTASEQPAEPAQPAEPEMTIGQKNALSKAQSYLQYTAFSAPGLIQQLEFEGFSTEDATYAVEHVGADWNEQAAKKAKSYLEMTSFSRDGLYDQLAFEGFTPDQIAYGLAAVGY